MSNRTTKKQRAAQHQLAREIESANIERIVKEVSSQTGVYATVLNSDSYGEVEAWNLATLWLQNAESDQAPLAAYVQCALADENKEVGAYFRALGIKF